VTQLSGTTRIWDGFRGKGVTSCPRIECPPRTFHLKLPAGPSSRKPPHPSIQVVLAQLRCVRSGKSDYESLLSRMWEVVRSSRPPRPTPSLQRTDEQVQTGETRTNYDVNPAAGSGILAPGCNEEVLSSKVDHFCALLEGPKNDETRTKQHAARARRQRERRRRRLFDEEAERIREEERRRTHTERKRMKRKRQRIAADTSVVETPGNGSNE
jgi:hypothetical protein